MRPIDLIFPPLPMANRLTENIRHLHDHQSLMLLPSRPRYPLSPQDKNELALDNRERESMVHTDGGAAE